MAGESSHGCCSCPNLRGYISALFFRLLFCPNISILDVPYAKELN